MPTSVIAEAAAEWHEGVEEIGASILESRATIAAFEAQLHAHAGDPEARRAVAYLRFVLDGVKDKISRYEGEIAAADRAVQTLAADIADYADDRDDG